MIRISLLGMMALAGFTAAAADETFVTIHGVSGNRIQVTKDDSGASGRGRGMRGGGAGPGGAAPAGRGRRLRTGGASAVSTVTITVPTTAKITSAMRERRTFEFRVLGEIPGGLRSSIFQRMKEPLKGRIVTKEHRITEISVISGQTDINQSATTSSGQSILAVRPKRPPMKRK